MHGNISRSEIPEGTLPKWGTHAVELDRLVRGFPRLAGEMEDVPTTTIFRRFAALNARSLLYYQQELIYMEDRDSVSTKPRRKEFASDSAQLQDSSAMDDSLQWSLSLQIREKLEKYSESNHDNFRSIYLTVLDRHWCIN